MQWISVKERLPEHGSKCIVWYSDTATWIEAEYSNQGDFIGFYAASSPRITHWMIPVGPKA